MELLEAIEGIVTLSEAEEEAYINKRCFDDANALLNMTKMLLHPESNKSKHSL